LLAASFLLSHPPLLLVALLCVCFVVAIAAAAAIAFASGASAFVVAFASTLLLFGVGRCCYGIFLLHQLFRCVSCCCCYGIGFRISFGTCISGRIFLRTKVRSST
jgi:hypothetical protein